MRALIIIAFVALPVALGTIAFGEASGQNLASPTSSQSDAGKQVDIDLVEHYLNGLSTAEADFTFVAPDGAVSRGEFYLSRPSKLRFEYTDPKGDLLIADGDYVIYWDASQRDASNLPIGQTPLSFLLKPKISLTDGVRILAYEHSAGVIRFKLAQDEKASDGSVTVAFSDQPLELRGWRLIDAEGQITDVTFANWRFGMSLAGSLFHFEGPHPGKQGR